MSTLSKNCQMNVMDNNGDIVQMYPASKIENIEGLQSALDGKVNTVSGKGLSSNDYTTTEKNKLAGIEAGANNYSLPAATSTALGGVKIGSNISNSSGTISLTKSNVTDALGFTPPKTDTNTHRTIKVDGNQLLGNNTTALNLTAGGNIKTLTDSSNPGWVRFVNMTWMSAKDIAIDLSQQTWTQSSSSPGLYYTDNISVPDNIMSYFLGANIVDFEYFPSGSDVQVCIGASSPVIWLMAKTNSFPSNSKLHIRVFGTIVYDDIN